MGRSRRPPSSGEVSTRIGHRVMRRTARVSPVAGAIESPRASWTFDSTRPPWRDASGRSLQQHGTILAVLPQSCCFVTQTGWVAANANNGPVVATTTLAMRASAESRVRRAITIQTREADGVPSTPRQSRAVSKIFYVPATRERGCSGAAAGSSAVRQSGPVQAGRRVRCEGRTDDEWHRAPRDRSIADEMAAGRPNADGVPAVVYRRI